MRPRDAFEDLPDQFGTLAAVFAARPDDFYIPTTLTGKNPRRLQEALDAFVSADGTATRFYLTSSERPPTPAAPFKQAPRTCVVPHG